MDRKYVYENGIHMVWEITVENEVRLLHFSAIPFEEGSIKEEEKIGFSLVEIALSGLNRPLERHGMKYTATAPGYRMKYAGHQDGRNEIGRNLVITTKDEETGIYVKSHFQFYDGIAVARCYQEVENKGEKVQGLEYISSFNLNGIEKEGIQRNDDKMKISVVHNSWQREVQWKDYTLPELGLEQSQPSNALRSSKEFGVTNTGNWSTKCYLPMGCVTNKEIGSHLFWQIEHNGSWHYEISDQNNHLYLQLSGPTENHSHWYKELKPGDVFTSVPVSVGSVTGGYEGVIEELTKYRRAIRRKNEDNESMAVIFNDYMNCLWAEPTTEKEIPLIDAASAIGCEYYCIDAGWYADGYWWDEVGEWLPSKKRFKGGIKEVVDYIRGKGMVPGLWLELEVMGICCPLAKELPDECFFMRHGKRVYDRSRYQLDFRHPKVIQHATSVIDRLVSEYGIGYIKMDYNIEPGIGTECGADSFGDGLLGHERAYLAWLEAIFEKYPTLIIENCSSGGLRMDYAMLKRYSIQSTSDQEDYRHYATIAANAPIAVTMEQSAIWSYPRMEGDAEETVFNMINALLMRVHQSGHMAEIAKERQNLVKEGLDYYKKIRDSIKSAYPFWPLGFSSFSDDWVSLGLKDGSRNYIAVWRRGGGNVVELPIAHMKGKDARLQCTYPSFQQCKYRWNKESGILTVQIDHAPAARLFELIAD